MRLFLMFTFITLTNLAFAESKTLPQRALDLLMEGNFRFRNDRSIYPDRTKERRLETALKQEPFAIVVGCSDSRVSPEILFDQGIGDLFIVRVAGNVIGSIELASIEYSALYLHSVVILVLGHQNCGAVTAVVQGNTKEIEPIAELIEPAVQKTLNIKENRLKATIEENVRNMVAQLNNIPVLKKLIDQKKLLVRGGYYNLITGEVELL